ncbi:hypothetical protein [Myroides odoratus]|uniref:hypothetical protein n=1 Tax=Myroides odoratus TaxID=256 RepID=UPI000765F8E6|nr:hypothetical protein [Myroides odoratus]
MKKIYQYIVVVFLLMISKGFAQINVPMVPNTTIISDHPFLDASEYSNSTPNNQNKGLYFPSTDLTKWMFKTENLDGITFPTAFNGMMVYNTGSGSTLADASKSGQTVIVEPGFYYFYNPNNAEGTSIANGYWKAVGISGIMSESWYSVVSKEAATSNAESIYQMGQVGIYTDSPDQSAALDIQSGSVTNKGVLFPRMTTAQRDAITTPATGLMIYNTSLNCLQTNTGSTTSPVWSCTGGDPSSNGSATVSSFNCAGSTLGILSTGVSANGITHIITADVTKAGNYVIAATSNGVTFFGSGVFAGTGPQEIILTAIGTPIEAKTTTFTLNTTPSCSFDINVQNGSSNGTAAVESWDCSTDSTGEMIVGQQVSGVTQTVTANVTTAGTYDIQVTNDGVTFFASGTFAGTGNQTIVLQASGVPLSAGTYSYLLNVSNSCNFTRSAVSKTLVSELNCSQAVPTDVVVAGVPVNGLFIELPYKGGNGTSFNNMLIRSTGVTGLTAVLNPGTLNNGSGKLVFNITGTAQGTGDAVFSVDFGGVSCEFKLNIELPGAVATIQCGAGTLTGSAKAGETLTGVTYAVTYTGGNGGSYSSLSVPSSGVPGLVAILDAGVLANGDGGVTFTITGNPTKAGTANFNFTFAGSTCSFSIPVAAPIASVTELDCTSATFSPTQAYYAIPVNGTVLVPYTGGNGGVYSTQIINSTGVRGLTLTLQGGTLASGNGNFQFTISGTPTVTGSTGNYAIFSLQFGGVQCLTELKIAVTNSPSFLPQGKGTFSGNTCFDVAETDGATGCGPLSSRQATKANFTQASTYIQQYKFTPVGTVSNVRFEIVPRGNAAIVESSSGGNAGNNITAPVVFTVHYKQNLNAPAAQGGAAGLTSTNALQADIYVIYNSSPTGGGTDYRIKITVDIKDCACCMADMGGGVFRNFLCHNLGADTSADPNIPSKEIMGGYVQWGKRGPIGVTGDSTIDWQTAPNDGPNGYRAAPMVDLNTVQIANWSTMVITDNNKSFWEVSEGKGINDPCPSGYRIPTSEEWKAVLNNNKITKIGNWGSSSATMPESQSYTQAIRVGPKDGDGSVAWLTLPAAGNTSKDVAFRGNGVTLWSTTSAYRSGNAPEAFAFFVQQGYSTSMPSVGFVARAVGAQVRCIQE